MSNTLNPNAILSAQAVSDSMLTTKQVAKILNISSQTLAVWRHRGNKELNWFVLGTRTVRYRTSEVHRYIASKAK